MKLLTQAAIPALLIIAFIYGAFLFLPGGALAMGCSGLWVKASWYGAETCHGRPPGHGKGTCHTAADIPFDGSQWLVANKTLPFHTKLRLSYRGLSTIVPVLDRGPYVAGRTLDLSRAVAEYLGTVKAGAPMICMERLQ